MEKDSGEQTNTGEILGTVKIEWNFDLDNETVSLREGFRPGNEGKARLKGRCKRCWGRLVGRTDKRHAVTGIRCCVCGMFLEGVDAKDEYDRMGKESMLNMMNMYWGHAPKYNDDATFVQKVFPYMDRQTKEQFLECVDAKASEGSKEGWLTRSEFPAGSAGYLFMQAKVLMTGVERIPREISVAQFSDFDMNDDGSATIYVSTKGLRDDPQFQEYEQIRKMGSTMTAAMMSAFACELAMKAIRLTRMHDAKKSHDLLQLYRDLPEDSRQRLNADFAEIEIVLKSGRHTFGRWRYFETNLGEGGMRTMIDTEKALALGKAARVIIDEAEMVGLGYAVTLDAKQKVTVSGNQRNYEIKHHLNAKGREAPPQ